MAYEVLYRKYRPRDFAGLVGQEHIRKALEHALERDRLHHAYLFTGTRGVGKTTIARILARCLNCERGIGVQPCGVCASCQEIEGGRFIDLIEVDAASSTKVEDTRALLDNVQYPPVRGRYKVYLIDEVHMLSNSSFNALLKTLEEPPPRVVFLLATTEPKRLPVTVLSRCLQFSLKSYRPEQIAGHLREVMGKEAVPFDDGALRLIARAARGSMRDALSLSDQAIAHGGGSLSADAVQSLLGTIDVDELGRIGRAVAANDASALFAVSASLAEVGADYEAALQRVSGLWHQVALAHAGVLPDDDADEHTLARELAQQLDPQLLQLLYQISVIGLRDIQLAPDPRIGFEMALLRMLAFAPELADTTPDVGPSSSHAALSSSRDTNSSAAARSSHDTSALTNIASALGHVTAPVAEPRPTPSPAASAPVRSLTAKQWLQLAPQLKLSGLARDLALHMTPRALDGDLWEFGLEPGRISLLTNEHIELIASAIGERLEHAPRLHVAPETAEVETPAARLARDAADRRAALLESVRADPIVRALQDKFGASIDESSLRPL